MPKKSNAARNNRANQLNPSNPLHTDNKSQQNNPNNDAYWQARGYAQRPPNWRELVKR